MREDIWIYLGLLDYTKLDFLDKLNFGAFEIVHHSYARTSLYKE